MTASELETLLYEVRMTFHAVRREIATQRLIFCLEKLAALNRRGGFNPAQLRIPAGNPEGGRWTDSGEGGDLVLATARGRGSVSVRVGNRTLDATPAQAARYAVANSRAEAGRRRVQELDPAWQPRPSLTDPNNIESQIRRAESEARDAEMRLAGLSRSRFGDNQGPPLDPPGARTGSGTPTLPPFDAINGFRAVTGMPDIGGGIAGPKTDGTVAFTEVDGRPVFGVNGNAPGYTVSDEAVARDMRSRLVERYPDMMATDNLGHIPNNARFHAEANALMRAVEPYGGTLAGRTIEIRVDRPLCPSCDTVLPLVGLQLGNPTVRFRDAQGREKTMTNGSWLD